MIIIFLSGFALSLAVYALLARYMWWDFLNGKTSDKAMALLLTPHAFRHLGLLILVPEVVGAAITKTSFASMLAYGDAMVSPLALMAMWQWFAKKERAKAVTWLFSIVGSLDLVNAIIGALTLPVVKYPIGAFWIVLTCVVPLLIVTQVMIFLRLAKS